ncbi:hypothetical protein C0991_003433 [Blastosporella zonata]|nr:hypothetical protein C0991_003433 [Blastosporella zonata]
MQSVLEEGDMSLRKGMKGKRIKELQVVSVEGQFESEYNLDDDEAHVFGMERKSPAAQYGSRQIGAVILPNQLQNAINTLISHTESDKVQLHSDAKRLFFDDESAGSESEWEAHYNPQDYRSRKQASRHSERDGTAFASVALPAHYSAILAVFDHLKRRLEPSYKVERVIDWGAATGSGLWFCPHDGACPLHHPGSARLTCGFSQRIQRPSFVRKTKHSGVGHEDIEYSYVVIRRGPRPISSTSNIGRLGEVGRRALEREVASQIPMKELELDSEPAATSADAVVEDSATVTTDTLTVAKELSQGELEEALRLESYNWPRLVFTPMKKSGHIILDGCTPDAKIMRMTIPKSQGKQEYYDARKASWGDMFPHPPKNPPQERHQPTRGKGGTTSTKGSDIGKRKQSKREIVTYEALSKDLKAERDRLRAERIHKLSNEEV